MAGPDGQVATALSMDCLGEEGIDAMDWPACIVHRT